VVRNQSRTKILRMLAITIIIIVVSSNVSIWSLTIEDTSKVPSYEDVLILQVGNSPEVVSASRILDDNLISYNEGFNNSQLNSPELTISDITSLYSIQVTSSISHIEPPSLLKIKNTITDIDHLDSVLIRNRATVLIIIGHGTPEGLVDEADTISWAQLASDVKRTDCKIPAILSCYSSKIQEFLPSAVGMDGEVDSTLGAIALSALVVSVYGGSSTEIGQFTKQFIDRVTILEQNPDRYQPLANWAAVSTTVLQIIRATPAPSACWTETASALKILGMVVGTILLILMDHMSSSASKMLGLIAGTIASVSTLVGLIGQITGLDQQFMIPIWYGTLNLWPVVSVALGILICGIILAFGTPLIALMNLVVRNGAGILLYSLLSYFASSISYNSLFIQIGKVFGNLLGSLLLPIIVTLFGMAGVYLSSYAQRIVQTCVYLLTVIVIFSAVDNLMNRVVSLFDVSASISASLQKSLTIWNICCWIVDWSMWLA
jgi:hypothetical protein